MGLSLMAGDPLPQQLMIKSALDASRTDVAFLDASAADDR
jgi:hypothetical protein